MIFAFAEEQEERYISFEWLEASQEAELTDERADAPVQKRRVGENHKPVFEMHILYFHSIHQRSEGRGRHFESVWNDSLKCEAYGTFFKYWLRVRLSPFANVKY